MSFLSRTATFRHHPQRHGRQHEARSNAPPREYSRDDPRQIHRQEVRQIRGQVKTSRNPEVARPKIRISQQNRTQENTRSVHRIGMHRGKEQRDPGGWAPAARRRPRQAIRWIVPRKKSSSHSAGSTASTRTTAGSPPQPPSPTIRAMEASRALWISRSRAKASSDSTAESSPPHRRDSPCSAGLQGKGRYDDAPGGLCPGGRRNPTSAAVSLERSPQRTPGCAEQRTVNHPAVNRAIAAVSAHAGRPGR